MKGRICYSSLDYFDVDCLRNENLNPNILKEGKRYAKEALARNYRKYTGEESKKHIFEVASFGANIAEENVKKYIHLQFLLHDYREEIVKAMEKKGIKNYMIHSPLCSEFKDEASFFISQNVRLMDKNFLEKHLISHGVLEKKSHLTQEEKEIRYRTIISSMTGEDYGLPIVLGRLPNEISPLICVVNKQCDLVSNIGFEDVLNIEYLKNRYNSQSRDESLRDIRNRKEVNLDDLTLNFYLEILENQFKDDKFRNLKRVNDLFPKLTYFSFEHPFFNFFFNKEKYKKFVDFNYERSQGELSKKIII